LCRTSLFLDCKGRFPPSPPEDAAYWPDTQLAKELMEFGQQFRNFSKRAGLFYMPQSWDMGQIILFPL
jgi:hypothetical protein